MKMALLGYGKMGRAIEELASKKGYVIVYKKNSASEMGRLDDADVAIEFSSPEAAFSNISMAIEKGIPVVSGTTGWLKNYDSVVTRCENKKGGFLYASNFSIGVNLFFELNSFASKLFSSWEQYDVDLTEIHHPQKKDAPSGTAITLAEEIIKNTSKQQWSLEGGDSNVLRIKAIREEDVKGIHTVSYTSKIDAITLKHEAFSREGFAMGAILAAEWIWDKKGVFTMKDVLKDHLFKIK